VDVRLLESRLEAHYWCAVAQGLRRAAAHAPPAHVPPLARLAMAPAGGRAAGLAAEGGPDGRGWAGAEETWVERARAAEGRLATQGLLADALRLQLALAQAAAAAAAAAPQL
jgi:hypothetical protein